MHKLLTIQLRKFFGVRNGEDLPVLPQELLPFLDAVDLAYQQFDRDLSLTHNSLNVSNEELHQLCVRQQQVLDALRETAKLLMPRAAGAWGIEDSDVEALVSFMHQLIQDRQEAEIILAEREAQHRTVLESVREVIFQVDVRGKIRFINMAWTEISGWTSRETLGKSFLDFIPQSDHHLWKDHYHEFLRYDLSSLPSEAPFLMKTGGTRWMKIFARSNRNGFPGMSGTLVDINEQKRQEVAMLQAQKLESLGVMAGGIAHDFNNLLVAIMGNADLAMRHIEDHEKSRQHLQQALIAVDRAAELCRQLLAYGGRGRFHTELADLNALVSEMAHLLRVSIGKNVSLEVDLTQGLPAILVDPSQVRQTVMNLVLNASESIGEKTGCIRIRTGLSSGELEGNFREVLSSEAPNGEFVFLTVEDDGCGMDEETQKRIFDPFFTTKFTGRGLGLAALLGIMRSHHGSLRLRSLIGLGTAFYIAFPATAGVIVHKAKDDELLPLRTDGLVLLADDEPSVRELVCDALKVMGFDVLEASNGRDALALFMKHKDELKAVILDLTMPLMGGEEVLSRVHAVRTDLPCVLMSGYSEQETRGIESGKDRVTFLQKPFKLADLSRVLRKSIS